MEALSDFDQPSSPQAIWTELWRILVWLFFIGVVLCSVYTPMGIISLPAAIAAVAGMAIMAYALQDRCGNITRRILFGNIGAVLGLLTTLVADRFIFPAAAIYGLTLLESIVLSTTLCCGIGMLIERRIAGIPVFHSTWKESFKNYLKAVFVMAFCFVIAVPLTGLIFGLMGIPGVYVGMAGVELHVRLRADVPALQQWLDALPPEAPDIPKNEWPIAAMELKPTRVDIHHGRLILRFSYGRLHDYSITLRNRNETVKWYQRIESSYTEH
jgi:hypothetical protein